MEPNTRAHKVDGKWQTWVLDLISNDRKALAVERRFTRDEVRNGVTRFLFSSSSHPIPPGEPLLSFRNLFFFRFRDFVFIPI